MGVGSRSKDLGTALSRVSKDRRWKGLGVRGIRTRADDEERLGEGVTKHKWDVNEMELYC